MLSQKFIIMVIILNLTIGIALEIGAGSSPQDIATQYGEFNENLGEEAVSVEEGEILEPGINTERDSPGGTGNIVEMGWKITKVLWNSAWFNSITADDDAHFVTKMVTYAISTFRFLLLLLVLLEIIMIIWSKKTS